jgi:coproporphyrinogen III oxidase
MSVAARPSPPAPSIEEEAADWFRALRDRICETLEAIEDEAQPEPGDLKTLPPPGRFVRKAWERTDEDGTPGGGGEMALLKGRVFEKVGVNVSEVHGRFSKDFRAEIPGAQESEGVFYACGLSLVAHPRSPHVPAVHLNTRVMRTARRWFGGGTDLTPTDPDPQDTADFHAALKACCDQHDPAWYPAFKERCDRYFYLPHRKETRGVGGIFYDGLCENDPASGLRFSKDVGETFRSIYPRLVRRAMHRPWTPEHKARQLLRRGRYVEFNLLYDRGTRFGLMTGGNIEAVLMSLPPEAHWP